MIYSIRIKKSNFFKNQFALFIFFLFQFFIKTSSLLTQGVIHQQKKNKKTLLSEVFSTSVSTFSSIHYDWYYIIAEHIFLCSQWNGPVSNLFGDISILIDPTSYCLSNCCFLSCVGYATSRLAIWFSQCSSRLITKILLGNLFSCNHFPRLLGRQRS